MADPRVQILDKTVCYDGFFRIERTGCAMGCSGVAGVGNSHVSSLREGMPRPCCRTILYSTRWCWSSSFVSVRLEAPGGPWLLEIVAGMIDKPDETPEDVVRREAIEEANCYIQDIVHICDYFVSPGGTSERISLFCGKVDAIGVGGLYGLAEEAEDIRVTVVPLPRP